MPETSQPKPAGSGTKWETTVALGITLAAIILHLIFLPHAGGLWRDESGGVQLANSSSLGEMWHELTHDSFPALYPLVLRTWSSLGLGSTDFGLRCFGLLIGLALLGALWWNTRAFGFRTPLISLSLLACNLCIIRWGDSLRGYGLGCVLMILCVGRIWQFVRQPTAVQFAVASLVAVLCVQSLYQCAFLIAASCLAGALVCVRRSRHQTGLLTLLLGLPAALSLLPYLRPLKASQEWWIVEKTGFNPRYSWHTLSTAMDTPMFLGPVIWIGLILVACFLGMALLEKRLSRRDDLSDDLPLFGAIAATGGAIGYFIFVVNAGLPTQPWYWLLLLTFLAVCVEMVLAKRLVRARGGLLIGIAVIAVVSFTTTLTQINQRMTNMDLVAAHLKEQAGPDDLIVTYPWYCGVSFQRYYRGQTPWTTLPEVADHRFHRYDQLKEKLQQPEPIRPVIEQIQRTLGTGGKVWLVGGLPQPEPGETQPPTLPPAPAAPSGWFDEPYNHVWGRQLEHFLRSHARKMEAIKIGAGHRYTRYEQIPLTLISGAPSVR